MTKTNELEVLNSLEADPRDIIDHWGEGLVIATRKKLARRCDAG